MSSDSRPRYHADPRLCATLLALALACGNSGAPNVPAIPPTITAQPPTLSVSACEPVTFVVSAAGSAPLSYQWRWDGEPIAGATDATYEIPAALPADAGAKISVTISNAYGSVTSDTATLDVTDATGVPDGPTVIAEEPGGSIVVVGDTVMWTVGTASVHATSARCPGAIRTLYSAQVASFWFIGVIGDKVYWANGNPGQSAIFRMPADGGVIESLPIPTFEIGGLTYWGSDFIWTDCYRHSIDTMPVGGGSVMTQSVAFPTGQSQPLAVATDGEYVYWADWNGDAWNNVQTMMINRMPLSGGPFTTLAADQGYVSEIRTDGQDVYWATTTGTRPDLTARVRKIDRDGGDVVELGTAAMSESARLLLGGGDVYWARHQVVTPDGLLGSGAITRFPKDGSGAPVIVANANMPSALFLDGSYLYWAESEFPAKGRVMRVRR